MYEVIIEDDVIDFLESLPKEISKRIIAKLENSSNNPFHFAEKQR